MLGHSIHCVLTCAEQEWIFRESATSFRSVCLHSLASAFLFVCQRSFPPKQFFFCWFVFMLHEVQGTYKIHEKILSSSLDNFHIFFMDCHSKSDLLSDVDPHLCKFLCELHRS